MAKARIVSCNRVPYEAQQYQNENSPDGFETAQNRVALDFYQYIPLRIPLRGLFSLDSVCEKPKILSQNLWAPQATSSKQHKILKS